MFYMMYNICFVNLINKTVNNKRSFQEKRITLFGKIKKRPYICNPFKKLEQ